MECNKKSKQVVVIHIKLGKKEIKSNLIVSGRIVHVASLLIHFPMTSTTYENVLTPTVINRNSSKVTALNFLTFVNSKLNEKNEIILSIIQYSRFNYN